MTDWVTFDPLLTWKYWPASGLVFSTLWSKFRRQAETIGLTRVDHTDGKCYLYSSDYLLCSILNVLGSFPCVQVFLCINKGVRIELTIFKTVSGAAGDQILEGHER